MRFSLGIVRIALDGLQRKIPINTYLRYLRQKAAWVNQMLHESKKESLKANASVYQDFKKLFEYQIQSNLCR